jgi:hypothetical protein
VDKKINPFHFPCINQAHKIPITIKKHFNVYDVFSLHFSHQHVSAGIAAIFRVKLLLQENKGTMWLVEPSLQNN